MSQKQPKKVVKTSNRPKKYKLPPMTPAMEFYYRAWLGRPTLFGHASDEHYFFLFVKACVQNSKAHRDGYWLRTHLETEEGIDEHWIDTAVEWFDICSAYDQSMRYYSGSKNANQFHWQPKVYRPSKIRLNPSQ